jgi:hypothetical protein
MTFVAHRQQRQAYFVLLGDLPATFNDGLQPWGELLLPDCSQIEIQRDF